MSNWTQDYEDILDKIRINSINLNKSHMKNYFYYKKLSKYFQIPTIILSSFNSLHLYKSREYIFNQCIDFFNSINYKFNTAIFENRRQHGTRKRN